MENLTLESLPKAFSILTHEVSEIKRLLTEKSNVLPADPDRWMNLTELCDYLPDKPAKATVYGWAQKNLIPYHKGGKRLRFKKSEIDDWLSLGVRKTNAELMNEADQYLSGKKRRAK